MQNFIAICIIFTLVDKIDEWYNALERDRDLSGEQEGVCATLTLVVREGRGKGL